MKLKTISYLLGGLVIVASNLLVYANDCMKPVLTPCPISQQYCEIRGETECPGFGAESFFDFFGLEPSTEDDSQPRLAPCWRGCTCKWQTTPAKCICDPCEPFTAPWSHTAYDRIDCCE